MDTVQKLKNAINYAKQNPDDESSAQLRSRIESGMYDNELKQIKQESLGQQSAQETQFQQQGPVSQFFSGKTLKEIPGAAWQTAKDIGKAAVREVAKFGVSAAEVPQTISQGKVSGKEYEIPGIGKFKSYQSGIDKELGALDPNDPDYKLKVASILSGGVYDIASGAISTLGVSELPQLAKSGYEQGKQVVTNLAEKVKPALETAKTAIEQKALSGVEAIGNKAASREATQLNAAIEKNITPEYKTLPETQKDALVKRSANTPYGEVPTGNTVSGAPGKEQVIVPKAQAEAVKKYVPNISAADSPAQMYEKTTQAAQSMSERSIGEAAKYNDRVSIGGIKEYTQKTPAIAPEPISPPEPPAPGSGPEASRKFMQDMAEYDRMAKLSKNGVPMTPGAKASPSQLQQDMVSEGIPNLPPVQRFRQWFENELSKAKNVEDIARLYKDIGPKAKEISPNVFTGGDNETASAIKNMDRFLRNKVSNFMKINVPDAAFQDSLNTQKTLYGARDNFFQSYKTNPIPVPLKQKVIDTGKKVIKKGIEHAVSGATAGGVGYGLFKAVGK